MLASHNAAFAISAGNPDLASGTISESQGFTISGVRSINSGEIYPNPSWNFVFGEASLRERVGVYSFARYDPAFYGGAQEGDYQKLLLWRSAKVLAHETPHTKCRVQQNPEYD